MLRKLSVLWRTELRHWLSWDAVQIVAGSIYGVIVIAYGLTGVSDFVFVVLVVFGVLLTAMAWHAAARSARDAERQEETLAVLVEQTRKDMPLSVEDLGALSNKELRRRAGDLAKRMRAFHAGMNSEIDRKFGDAIRYPDNASKEERDYLWLKNNDDRRAFSEAQRQSYKQQFAPEAVSLRTEMCRRLGMETSLDHRLASGHRRQELIDIQIALGILPGPFWIDAALNELEGLARKLP
jgi:hypothetical protein